MRTNRNNRARRSGNILKASAIALAAVAGLTACSTPFDRDGAAGNGGDSSNGLHRPTTTLADDGPSAVPVTTVSTVPAAQPLPEWLDRLPAPLTPVDDPGTVDPNLGAFPTDVTRDVQFAWVDLADRGRAFLETTRSINETVQQLADEDVYMNGVLNCVELSQNYSVDSVLSETADAFIDEFSSDQASDIAAAITAAAINLLCPDLEGLAEDPDLLVPTPVMLRSLLGLDSSDLQDSDANQVANGICNELDGGSTISRLATEIASSLDYPDDLAELLVENVADFSC
jgi:hypothetical protein